MNRNEIWKPVIGYEGYYEVSNYGRVKTLPRTVYTNVGKRFVEEKIRCGYIGKRGYCIISLSKDNSRKLFPIHRLVLMAFVPNPNSKTDVDHIDGNRTNNVLENLRWATRKENLDNPNTKPHMKKTKSTIEKILNTRKERNTCQAPMTVHAFNINGEYVKSFSSMGEAGRNVGVHAKQIQMAIDNNSKMVGGFLWSRNRNSLIKYTPYIDPRKKPVAQIDEHGAIVRRWDSAKETATSINTRESYLTYTIRNGLRCKGRIFIYL